MTDQAECRHDFQCDGWTVDPANGTCRVCGQAFVFWSRPQDPDKWVDDPAAATLATLRAWHNQPVPDWDALIAEQDAREAARYATPPAPPAPPTAATAMPARALRPLQAAHGFRVHIRW